METYPVKSSDLAERWPAFPVIYEINTWVWLHDLSCRLNHPVTLRDVPQAELERLASYRFDAVWLMGVWERSPAARRIAREDPRLWPAYEAGLPGWSVEDVVGSPFAIHEYRVDPALGGDEAVAALRERLRQLGLRLMLDFVPNHLALDHPWLAEHPERLLQGNEDAIARNPHAYFRSDASGRPLVFAHGREQYFPPWTDTVQLDYRRPETRQAMKDILLAIAERCDGVRCDMAMLETREVFCDRIWGGTFDPPDAEFWSEALTEVRAANPNFLVMGEVYWNLEYKLLQLGFDYAYDKPLYDFLVGGNGEAIRAHLRADFAYQRRVARFIENHDEPRALATFGSARSRAVATLALTLPGLRLVHDGQLEGRRLKLPVQLGRAATEPTEPALESFYRRLLEQLSDPVFRKGSWRLIEPKSAWNGNPSHINFVAHVWTSGDEIRLVIVNLASHQAQCLLPLDSLSLTGGSWDLFDLLSRSQYVRRGDELVQPGLFVDLPAFGCHLFRFKRRP